MPLTTINELFNGNWGIVAERRRQIESGAYDTFEKVHQEEVDKRFFPISKVAELLTCHEPTARILLKKEDARFIRRGLAYFYFKDDVEAIKRLR